MICPDETLTISRVLESLLVIFHDNEVSSISWIFQSTMNMSTLSEVCATVIQDNCGVVVDDTRIQSAGLLIEMTRCHLDEQSRVLDVCVVHTDTTIGLDLSTTLFTVDTVEGALTNTSRPTKMARSCHDKDGSDSDDDDTNNTIAATAAAATATMTAASSSAVIAWNEM